MPHRQVRLVGDASGPLVAGTGKAPEGNTIRRGSRWENWALPGGQVRPGLSQEGHLSTSHLLCAPHCRAWWGHRCLRGELAQVEGDPQLEYGQHQAEGTGVRCPGSLGPGNTVQVGRQRSWRVSMDKGPLQR